MNPNFEKLGTPSIKLENLQIWIHGRQFPELNDYWDGNWLRVTVHCGGNGSSVWASGPIIHLGEIAGFHTEIQRLSDTLRGSAELKCIEPNLGVVLKANTGGHINVEISITPDQMTQRHKYIFEVDQTYLSPLIRQCEQVLENYPIKDPPASVSKS